MKISHIEVHLIRVPFDMGAAPMAFAGMQWTSVDSLFVRVLTDEGVQGWGEGRGHVACPSTLVALSSLVGRGVEDRSALVREMQHRFHISTPGSTPMAATSTSTTHSPSRPRSTSKAGW